MINSGEDITDVLLENKLLFEQLNEFKSSERQYLNEVGVTDSNYNVNCMGC